MKLTVVDPNLEELRAKTPAGMAFWAGTGPQGKTCRECIKFIFNGYKADGVAKNAACKKYADMMGSDSKKFPFDTPSCKYFEQNDNPPSAFKKD